MNILFADTLKRLRTEKGLSQIQLGKQMSVSNSTIARWENGSRLPDFAMLSRLAEVEKGMAYIPAMDYARQFVTTPFKDTK